MLDGIFEKAEPDDSFNQLVDSRYDYFTIRCFALWVMDSLMLEMSVLIEKMDRTLL